MNLVIRGAMTLAAIVTIWSIALFAFDVHQNGSLFRWLSMPPTTAVNVVIVYLTLRKTADTQAYRQQLASGALLGAVAGVLIAATTWLTLTVLFPDASQQSNAAMVELWREQGGDAAQMTEVESFYDSLTPFRKATFAAWGTMFTSLIAAAIISVGNRRREP